MGVVLLRRYIDILTIIINFPFSTCISSFFGSSIPIVSDSFPKMHINNKIYVSVKAICRVAAEKLLNKAL